VHDVGCFLQAGLATVQGSSGVLRDRQNRLKMSKAGRAGSEDGRTGKHTKRRAEIHKKWKKKNSEHQVRRREQGIKTQRDP
jgi:hypothetical protein